MHLKMTENTGFPIGVNDYELFEQNSSPIEFEYFFSHDEAFKCMWLEKVFVRY